MEDSGQAIDLARPMTAAAIRAARAAGVVAIGRYLSRTPAKNLTPAEAKMISAAGIRIISVWEAAGNHYSSYTATRGRADAREALRQAAALTVPAGAVIYFCGADFDATDAQIAGGISAYGAAVRDAFRAPGAPWRIGVYGNGAVCARWLDVGFATAAWVWGAMETNGTRAFVASNRWAIRQHPTVRRFGLSVDPDDVRGDYGGWVLPRAAAPTA